MVQASGSSAVARDMMNSKGGNTGYFVLPPIVEEMTQAPVSDRKQTHGDNYGFFVCWGSGEFGQHCHGNKEEVTFQDGCVEKFCGQNAGRIKLVGCGSSHTVVVTNSNEIYVWGNGNSGQLGCKDLDTHAEPTKIELYKHQAAPPKIAGVACGGRHTMIWLENGHVFSFGNNFYAQLGYDFKEKNYKENQTQPTLLKLLIHRPVAQIACGDKHTIFRFKDGVIAGVGNNAHGQLGTDNREDSVVPKLIGCFQQRIRMVATGTHHSLAVTETGEVYVWGYSKACGRKSNDVLVPTKQETHKHNVISAAGGGTHSMALTANGSVYTWGDGMDGQLGHGDHIKFLEQPKRIKDRHIAGKVIQISCGETYSAAVTGKGLLYLWGRNSHIIYPGQTTTQKIFLPHGVNKNFRGGRVNRVFCGFWHAAAILGRPSLLLRGDEDSSLSEEEADKLTQTMSRKDILPPATPLEKIPDNELESTLNIIPVRERTHMSREKTQMSIADFYAPTPEVPKEVRSPTPELYYPSTDEWDPDRHIPNSARSHTLVVQVPVQAVTSYIDAATSPMTLSTTSGSKTSSMNSQSRVPSPVLDLPTDIKPVKRKPDRKFREFEPLKHERTKIFSLPVSETVQVSKTSADSFTLPREPTQVAQKHVDFSELEESRLSPGNKSPEKLSRLGRHSRELKEPYSPKLNNTPTRFKDHLERFEKLKELTPVRSNLRHIDSSLSFKSDSILMDSPLFRSSRNAITSNQTRKHDNALESEEERQYKHHVPKQIPRKYTKPKQAETNFALQISRSKTIVTPVLADPMENADRIAQLKRYAAMHNPHAMTSRGGADKLRPVKARHVSIPAGRTDSPNEEADKLCIGNSQLQGINKPSFSSGSAWRDKADFDRLPNRKGVHAGIVKMYIKNNELVGAVEKPLYTSISDGSGHIDDFSVKDPLVVQSLLKSPVKLSSDEMNLGFPSIASPGANVSNKKRRDKHKIEGSVSLPASSRIETAVDSRVG